MRFARDRTNDERDKVVMSKITCLVVTAFALSLVSDGPAVAEDGRAATGAGIAWYGTWEQGLAQARRENRPILLVSAAPHCRNISGIW